MTAWHNDPISPERAKALLALPLEDKEEDRNISLFDLIE